MTLPFDTFENDLEFLARLLERTSGMETPKEKYYLFHSRLESTIKKNGFDDLTAFVARVRLFREKHLIEQFINAMSINETSFFRGEQLFTRLKTIIQDISQEQKSIKIWCSAASTGQEPYSIGIFLLENKELFPECSFEILGSDISSHAINIAQKGQYSDSDLRRGLPDSFRNKYFKTNDNGLFSICNDVKSLVTFKVHNFLEPLLGSPRFDIIICRNSLIYFKTDKKAAAIKNICDHLKNKRYFCIATTESLSDAGCHDTLIDIKEGIYLHNKGVSNP